MKWIALAVCLLFAGCADPTPDPAADGPAQATRCQFDGQQVLYMGPGLSLARALPDAGRSPGNGFDEAFLTNELDEWTTDPANVTYRINGTMTLEFWTQGNAMPAPIVIGGDPGEGYHFFNQFGTNRGFIESYAIEYESAVGDTEVRRFVETFQMPEGGLLVEAGDHLRLLLTNLVLDEPGSGRGPDILWGGDTPSRIEFRAVCEETPSWSVLSEQRSSVSIQAHQGLLTGAVPAEEGINYADVEFELQPAADRLEISMRQTSSPNPTKNDMDITVLDATGTQVWSIGSPYTDEIGTRWRENLGDMPPGSYTVRVNSYSGLAYEGIVEIRQWQRL